MNGTINRIPEEMHKVPRGGKQIAKVDMYDWKIVDNPGDFQMLPKTSLNIDHEYQRKKISQSRVLNIARRWSWAALGVIMVAKRPDGTFWVFDGQHRKLAADKRADIQYLPCLVFGSEKKVQEAQAFLSANTDRGPMKTIDRFNAMIMANNESAMMAKSMVEQSGYHISPHRDKFGVNCISALMKAINSDPVAAQVAWDLTVDIFEGESPHENIYSGLFMLEVMLKKKNAGTLASRNNRDALIRLGSVALLRSINEAVVYNGGGSRSYAEGIARLLNKGRRTNRIPTPHESQEVDLADDN